MNDLKVIVLTCNWNAYSGLEAAGKKQQSYPPAVHPLRVTCLGQISPGIILKAFQKGADGVLMLGCPPRECHYGFGNARAEEVYAESQDLLTMLGYQEEQLQLAWLEADDGDGFVETVQDFIAGLTVKKLDHD
jgi:coenzyme F420-reducing hydrogenase delta subunit